MRWFISIGVKYYVVYRNSLTNMVRSISIYQPEKGDGEREFNQCHIISGQRKTRHLQKNNKDYKQGKKKTKKLLSYLIIKEMRILQMENKKEEVEVEVEKEQF
jgi:hypothetical protein